MLMESTILNPGGSKKPKDKTTRDVQYLYLCPKHKTEGGFDEIYMNHTAKNHDKWDEENQGKI